MCNGVQLNILWYRKSRTIQLKCTFETKKERITVSYHPTHHHGYTKFWCVCLLERAYFDYFESAAMIYGMCVISGVHGQEPRLSRGNISSNQKASALFPQLASNGMERVYYQVNSGCQNYRIHYIPVRHISDKSWSNPMGCDIGIYDTAQQLLGAWIIFLNYASHYDILKKSQNHLIIYESIFKSSSPIIFIELLLTQRCIHET